MKKIMVIAAAVMVLSAAVSCEKYEDGRPSKDVRAEFSRMYLKRTGFTAMLELLIATA